MKKTFYICSILLTFLSCNKKESQSSATDSINDSIQNYADELSVSKIQEEIESSKDSIYGKPKHTMHDEDKNRNWSDTRLGINWVKQSFKDSLINIFSNDTTRSLFDYFNRIDLCEDLTFFKFEGCLKDELYFLINENCDNVYIGVSELGIEKKDTFEILNYYSKENYTFYGEGYNELYVDGEKYTYYFHDYNFVWRPLKGNYLMFDSKEMILDTIRYSGNHVSNSDTLESMYLQNLFYVKAKNSHPTYENSDLITAHLFNGDTLYDDYEDYWYKATNRVQFDLVRTSIGFELHNGIDRINNIKNEGLVFKFVRMEQLN